MTAPLSPLVSFAQSQLAPQPATAPQGLASGNDGGARFSSALASALQAQASLSGGPASAAAAPQSAATAAADAAARARAALQLEPPNASTATQSNGDAVLNGLQKLRGVFNQEMSSFSNSFATVDSTEGLYRAQAAATQFSMFIDVSSKLAGKATQAFQTLLKGQ